MTALVIPTDAPSVTGPPQGRWTYADWERLPDDGNRYEVIDGVLYMSTAPSFFHQWITLQLVEHIGIPAKQQGLAIPAFAPIGVLMPGCDPVQPDFVIVLSSRASIIHDRRIWGVPDAIVEILSPSNRPFDEEVKFLAYARAGLPEYVIVDPGERQLRHYRLAQPDQYAEPRLYGEADDFHFDCLPAFPVHVGDLFAGSPDTAL
ncbi:MAG TPA: Uma2 family endonuclease [Chloroflexota bacterium]|jgi:Uma2 family endonuclease|nr:Uma2 family endonuclease [Chloroflexota bacterium]